MNCINHENPFPFTLLKKSKLLTNTYLRNFAWIFLLMGISINLQATSNDELAELSNPLATCDGVATGIQLVGSNGSIIDLTEGQTLCRSDLDFSEGHVSVRTRGSVGSMRIWTTGATDQDVLENLAPYDGKRFTLNDGDYNVMIQIFSAARGGGSGCSRATFHFSIEDCASAPEPTPVPAPTPAPTPTPTPTPTCAGTETGIQLVGVNGNTIDISEGGEVCINDIDFSEGFVRVTTTGSIGSMRIWITGGASSDALENITPYDSRRFNITTGDFKVRTRINSRTRERGTNCEENTFRFSIVECDASSCEVNGGTLRGGPFEFCVDNGEADNIAEGGITLNGGAGANRAWVVTDDSGNILGLPPTFSAVNFDDAGAGTCLVWYIAYEDGLTGLEMGSNTADLEGCYDLSNSVVVNRFTEGGPCPTTPAPTPTPEPAPTCAGTETGIQLVGVNGNTIDISEGGEVCISDIDFSEGFVRVTTTGSIGSMRIWITGGASSDALENITPYDSRRFNITTGDFKVRTRINSRTRERGTNCEENTFRFSIVECDASSCEVSGGTLRGGPFEFCVDNGEADNIPEGGITLNGGAGANRAWVVTDDSGNILGLPPTFSAVNFDGAGAGTCLVWYIAYEDGLTGLEMGNNTADLNGCYDLSNSVVVNRFTEGGPCPTTPAPTPVPTPTPTPAPAPTCAGSETGIQLVGVDGSTIDISEGGEVCISDIDFTRGFVRVTTTGSIGSMRIWITGGATSDALENFTPYDSRRFNITTGDFNVRTRINSEARERGTNCEENNFNFSIIECESAPAPAPTPTPTPEPAPTPTPTPEPTPELCDAITEDNVLGGEIRNTACDENGTIIIENVEGPSVPNGFDAEVVWITGACNNLGALQAVNVGDVYNTFIAAGGFEAGADPSIPGTLWSFITDNDGDDLQLTITEQPRACYLRCTRVPECNNSFLGETNVLEVFDDCIEDECTPITITVDGSAVTVTNPEPIYAVQILDSDNSQIAQGCAFNCNETETYDLPAGSYTVIVSTFNSAFAQVCQKIELITIRGAFTNDVESSSRSRASSSTGNLSVNNSFEKAEKIHVYPNPVQHTVQVDISQFEGQSGQLSLYNQIGQKVKLIHLDKIEASPVSLQMGQLATGVYHLMVTIDGQLIKNEKIVKQ